MWIHYNYEPYRVKKYIHPHSHKVSGGPQVDMSPLHVVVLMGCIHGTRLGTSISRSRSDLDIEQHRYRIECSNIYLIDIDIRTPSRQYIGVVTLRFRTAVMTHGDHIDAQ